jgi:Cu+-exporting ATPase
VPETLKDPVCGMAVTPQSPHRAEFEGRPVYFCGAGCKAKFVADPHKYMHPAPAAAPGPDADPAPPGTVYTCPMHPEVR